MRGLAWDTSSKAGAIVAFEGNLQANFPQIRSVAELSFNVEATHSERLLWGIHQVLQAARWKMDDVDIFGVGVGPGSFTGLRIGLTTARTLAYTLEKPLIPVSSLAALARPAANTYAYESDHSSPPLIIAASDASKGQLFVLSGLADQIQKCSSRTFHLAPFKSGSDHPSGIRELVENSEMREDRTNREDKDDDLLVQAWHPQVVEEVISPDDFTERMNSQYWPKLISEGSSEDQARETSLKPGSSLQSENHLKNKARLGFSHPDLKWIVVGEGRHRYLKSWEKLPAHLSLTFNRPHLFSDFVQPRDLGQLVWETYLHAIPSTGTQESLREPLTNEFVQRLMSPLAVYPQYLRVSDAEMKLNLGLLGQKKR